MRGKQYVKTDIKKHECQAGYPHIANIIERWPGWVAVAELRFGFKLKFEIIQINVFSFYHKPPNVFYEMWRVRVFFGIAIGMVHAVQDRVGPRVQEGGALAEKSEPVKELFPEFIHLKHLMRCVAV